MGAGDSIGRGGAVLRALDREMLALLSDATRHGAFATVVAADRPRTLDDIVWVAADGRREVAKALRVLEHRGMLKSIGGGPELAYVLGDAISASLAHALVEVHPDALRALADPVVRDVALAVVENGRCSAQAVSDVIARPAPATARTLALLDAAGLVHARRRPLQRPRYQPRPALVQLVRALLRVDEAFARGPTGTSFLG